MQLNVVENESCFLLFEVNNCLFFALLFLTFILNNLVTLSILNELFLEFFYLA